MGVESVEADEVENECPFGAAVRPRKDPELVTVTGRAEFTDDVRHPDTAYMAIVRSQYAHARIESIDASDAESVDGVVGVYTAADSRISP